MKNLSEKDCAFWMSRTIENRESEARTHRVADQGNLFWILRMEQIRKSISHLNVITLKTLPQLNGFGNNGANNGGFQTLGNIIKAR